MIISFIPVLGLQFSGVCAYLEEDLDPVDEEEDDDDKHEYGVAAVEYVSVELAVLVVRPHHAQLGHQQRVGDDIEHQETEERLQWGERERALGRFRCQLGA